MEKYTSPGANKSKTVSKTKENTNTNDKNMDIDVNSDSDEVQDDVDIPNKHFQKIYEYIRNTFKNIEKDNDHYINSFDRFVSKWGPNNYGISNAVSVMNENKSLPTSINTKYIGNIDVKC